MITSFIAYEMKTENESSTRVEQTETSDLSQRHNPLIVSAS